MGVALFILILVVLIVGHELGHFLVAKRAGMEVPEFGVGFPPKLWSVVRGSTEYSVNALPFGGFVRIVGEDGATDHPHAFSKKPKVAQAAVLCAGPAMNVVLGFLAFWVAFMVGFPTVVDDAVGTHARVVVSEVVAGSPVAEAGVQVGDVVQRISVSGETYSVDHPTDISDALALAPARVVLTVERVGVTYEYELTPARGVIPEEPDRVALGVGSVVIADVSYGFFESLWRALVATVNGLGAILSGLRDLLLSAVSFNATLETLSGPVGIASQVSVAAETGWGQVFAFAGIISLNLAVLNLLPFPALDGGRLLFLGIETLRGRPLRPQVASILNTLGFVLLIALMIAVTYQDIFRLVS